MTNFNNTDIRYASSAWFESRELCNLILSSHICSFDWHILPSPSRFFCFLFHIRLLSLAASGHAGIAVCRAKGLDK
jgi:hypothetical protein